MTTATLDLPEPFERLARGGLSDAQADEILAALPELDARVRRFACASEEDFRRGYAAKGLLTRLACYTFNLGHPAFQQVAALEGALGGHLTRFARRYSTRISPEARSLVRYLLWTRRFRDLDLGLVIERLVAEQAILRHADQIYVRGLHLAVGDNVFGIRADGSQYRLTARACVPQVYPVQQSIPPELAARIPEEPVPDFVARTPIGDGKGCARVSLGQRDRAVLARYFR